MTGDSGEQSSTLIPDPEVPTKRRKVRKGTRSCWECKRRKISCVFASAENAVCVGCQRRHTPCVSQEVPEDLSLVKKGNQYLGERMARVEDVMRDLLAGRPASLISHEDLLQGRRDSSLDLSGARSSISGPLLARAPPTPAESAEGWTPRSALLTPDSQGTSGQVDPDTIASHLLRAALPSDSDIKILLRESPRPSLYINLVHTQPHSKLTLDNLAAPCPIAEVPDASAHPLTLARCMLLFAITLQSPSGEKFVGLSEPQSIISYRLVTAATTWVTTKEEMHGTVDSLICMILEGVYKVNCGDLRRAWAVYRRAMTVAQLMGLHRPQMPPLKRIDPDLKADPAFLWFRIVYMDRYLSLLLGLPQGTADTSMTATSVLRHEPPLGQFERQLTVIASRILERNERPFTTSETITNQYIDSELLQISKNMPLSFWRPANFQNLIPGSPENLLETVRLGAQVYYYGLLIQLHIPYMMRAASDSTEHEYAKMTCVNASREIMMRFIAHRSFHPVSSCSRPVDMFALLAAMTLLLAHLNAHRHQGATNFLAHQRLSDRAMLHQALERMDVLSNVNKDAVAEESAKLIRHLLDIEDDAAGGSSYTEETMTESDNEAQDGHRDTNGDLRLHIPYLGTIKIARQGFISREPPSESGIRLAHDQTTFHSNFSTRDPALSTANNTFPSDPHTSSHPFTSPVTSSTPLIPTRLSDLPWQSAHVQFSSKYTDDNTTAAAAAAITATNQDESTMLHQSQLSDLPDIVAASSDWAFQGVEMAYFDNLLRGSSSLTDFVGLEQ